MKSATPVPGKLEPPCILAIDDAEDIRQLIAKVLAGDYRVKTAPDGTTGLKLAAARPAPDLILLDVSMPGLGGIEVCRRLKADPVTARIPVVFLSGLTGLQDEMRGFDAGGVDYLGKPILPGLLKVRVANHLALLDRRRELERLVAARTRELEDTRLQLMRRLARAMEFHENAAMGNRVMRVSHAAKLIAQAAGAKPELCELMLKAAPLYDIGKLAVPAELLRKSDRLTDPETEQMRRHCEAGAKIIGESGDPLLRLACVMALTHHERWDGLGYPKGLKGEDIPWPGRVMALVDVWESMSNTQYRRAAHPPGFVAAHVAAESGRAFDPALAAAFARARPALDKVRDHYADSLGEMLDLDFTARAR